MIEEHEAQVMPPTANVASRSAAGALGVAAGSAGGFIGGFGLFVGGNDRACDLLGRGLRLEARPRTTIGSGALTGSGAAGSTTCSAGDAALAAAMRSQHQRSQHRRRQQQRLPARSACATGATGSSPGSAVTIPMLSTNGAPGLKPAAMTAADRSSMGTSRERYTVTVSATASPVAATTPSTCMACMVTSFSQASQCMPRALSVRRR